MFLDVPFVLSKAHVGNVSHSCSVLNSGHTKSSLKPECHKQNVHVTRIGSMLPDKFEEHVTKKANSISQALDKWFTVPYWATGRYNEQVPKSTRDIRILEQSNLMKPKRRNFKLSPNSELSKMEWLVSTF